MECGTDYTAEPPRRLTPHGLEVLREALAEVKRLRERHTEPVPDPFRHQPGCTCDMNPAEPGAYDHLRGAGAVRLPAGIGALPDAAQAALEVIAAESLNNGRHTYAPPADGRSQWYTIAALSSQLLAVLDGTPYAYPALKQDTADFARDQLARAAAAALWLLIRHVADGGDEDHLEAFAAAMFGPGRLPAEAADVLGPPFVDLARFIITTIEAQRAGAEPEATS
jgi:hypothetical protein